MSPFSGRSAFSDRFHRRLVIPILLIASGGGSAWAQAPQEGKEPANIVNIAASGFLEVQQDWLSVSLNTTRDGPDAALAVAKTAAQPQQMEVRTGQFSLYPRYGTNGKINGWQGSTELVIEGRDFARISTTAGKIQTLTMGHVGFSLSREARQKL